MTQPQHQKRQHTIKLIITIIDNNRSDSDVDKQTTKIELEAVKHTTGQLHQTAQTTH